MLEIGIKMNGLLFNSSYQNVLKIIKKKNKTKKKNPKGGSVTPEMKKGG
jgi:hypothetical protein